MLDREMLCKHLEERLKPSRYHHSLCVEEQARNLAALHGADRDKAALAGLVHDVCRSMPYDGQLKYLEARGILLDDFTRMQPPLWHALCGAEYVQEAFGITDSGLLDAIRYHTTGRAGMGLLEKVVFLADATSRDREYPGVGRLRVLAGHSLDMAITESLLYTMRMLLQSGQPIVRSTWEAYNYYITCGEDETIDFQGNG